MKDLRNTQHVIVQKIVEKAKKAAKIDKVGTNKGTVTNLYICKVITTLVASLKLYNRKRKENS